MSPAGNVNGKSITFFEFKEALKNAVFSKDNEKEMLSIFEQVSGSDGVINADDMNALESKVGNEQRKKSGNYSKTDNSFRIFYDFIKNIFKKIGAKVSDRLAKKLEQDNIGKNIEKIDNDAKKGTTKIQCKIQGGGYKIVEYDNSTNNKLKEVEHDKNGKLVKSVEYKNGQIFKSVEFKNNLTISTDYEKGKPKYVNEENPQKKESIDTIYEGNVTTTKKYVNGAFVESTITDGNKSTRTVYKNDKIDYVEERSGGNVKTIPYYDGKNKDDITNGIEKIKQQLAQEHKGKTPKDKVIITEALNKKFTPKQIEIYFGAENLQKILDSNKELKSYFNNVKNEQAMNSRTQVKSEYSAPSIDYGKLDLQMSQEATNDTTYVVYAQDNDKRAEVSSWDESYFDTNWVQEDKFGSKSIDEFMQNLKKDGLEYDSNTGKKLVTTVKKTEYKPGYCAAHIYTTFCNMGDKQYNSLGWKRHNSAFQAAQELANSGLFKEVPRNIVATMDLNNLPDGAVAVWDANYRTDGAKMHENGHIAVCYKNKQDNKVYTIGATNAWAIDDTMNGKAEQGTHLRIFLPVKQV